jgi:DNA-binding transcriptional LysR family regulator
MTRCGGFRRRCFRFCFFHIAFHHQKTDKTADRQNQSRTGNEQKSCGQAVKFPGYLSIYDAEDDVKSEDTEQIADKLDKGLLDFLVLAELPDSRKYEYLAFPEKDVWGLVIPEENPLSEKDVIRMEDLKGLPLFCSEQAWNGDIKKWAGSSFSKMKLEGSFRLSYNGSIFVREGLGYLLTFRDLIDTSKESGLVFRPLEPALETTLYIAWNRYQAFTPIAERFLKRLKESFFNAG